MAPRPREQEAPSRADASVERPPLKASVLLVDDDEGVRVLVGRVLSASGYLVRQAASVAEALETLDAGLPDVAVLDFSLPDGDAFDLLPRLRRDDALVPVGLLTAYASIELAVRAIKEGAEQFPGEAVLADGLEALAAAQAAGDEALLRRAAHGLKGASGTLGALRLSMLCADLEGTVAGQPQGASVETIRAELAEVLQALRGRLARPR